jgi:membrane fusion protein (multidrug efflux system)
MASKIIYSTVAVLGIAAASGAAWWYQAKSPAPSTVVALNAGAAGATLTSQAKGSVGISNTGNTGAGPAAARPPSVESAKVEVMKLTDDTQTVGSLKSRQGVMLRPEVSGRITQLNFRDGAGVKKGQLLVQFDDQLQLAQVKQSQAELSIALANHKRNQDLVAQNFISKRSVDESAANLEVAQAKLVLSQAMAARLKIIAPFDGITGIRAVNVGDYLKDGGDIVNIEDIAAVFVDFRLPERFQAKLKKGQTVLVDMDALPGRKFTAVIQAIDPLVDANGRSVGARACIDNRQGQLRPGMFARVNAVFGERENAKVIPEEAIVPLAGKQYVIKLVDTASSAEKDGRTTQRVEVKVGLRRPGRVEILDGLNEGDEVVIAGQQRIQKDGTTVKVMNQSRSTERASLPASTVTGVIPVSEAKNPGQNRSTNPSDKAMLGPDPCLESKPAGRA